MTQKEKSLLVIKAIIMEEVENPDLKPYLIEKIEACLKLANPEVLLTQNSKKIFEKLVAEERGKGEII